jgi:hypothetical protein
MDGFAILERGLVHLLEKRPDLRKVCRNKILVVRAIPPGLFLVI